MAFFTWLLIAIVASVALSLLVPPPETEKLKAATLDDFNFPITREGTPVTMFWGRVRLSGPNVLWYGDLRTVEVTEEVQTGLFSSEEVTVGYRYFVGMHLGLGLPSQTAANTRLLRFWSEEEELWSGDLTLADAGTDLVINEPDFYGGRKEGGGFVGTIQCFPGTFNHSLSTYLTTELSPSSLVPAYNGLCHLVFEQTEIGETPSLRPYAFEVESIPNALGLGSVGSNGDANPVEILYDIMTRDWGGLDIDVTNIDSTSFLAAGNTLATEGLGMSFAVASASDARKIIQEILRQIDGVIYEEPGTRKIVLKLIRNDYVVDDLPDYDETNVIAVSSFSRSLWSQTSNQARVIFNNRSEKYEEKTAFVQDLSNIQAQGGIKSVEFNYPGVKEASVANQIATRELATISIPVVKLRLIVNRAASTLRPGDVIKFSWDEYGIEDMLLRVQKYDLGEYENNEIALDLVEDIFAISYTIHADPPDSEFAPPSEELTDIAVHSLIAAPRWFNVQDSSPLVENEMLRILYLAEPNDTAANSINANISIDGGSTYLFDRNVPFTPTGRLAESVSYTDDLVFSAGFNVDGLSDTSVIASATDNEVSTQGANLILIDEEIMAFTGFFDLSGGVYTLTNVWRGLLDTAPADHADNAVVYFLTPENTRVGSFYNLIDAGNYDFKLQPRDGFGILSLNDATNIDVTATNRPELPYLPSNLTIGGTRHPASVSGTSFTIAWSRRDRLSTDITKPSTTDEVPGDNVIDTNATDYIVRWRLNGGSWTEVDMGSGTSHLLDVGGLGTVDLEIYAQRNDDTNLRSEQYLIRSFDTV